jgi:hypothetical protein
MKYEGKIFEVREYNHFPNREDSDDLIREFPDLETAQFESMYLNRKAKLWERYYVIDNPHTEIEAEPELEKFWRMVLNKCGLRAK